MPMKVKELIKELKQYDENSVVTINCPNANDSRDIWYVEQDHDPEFSNFIDIVMKK
jgi:hypothetical protein